jgi:glucose-1-phosphate thymidylyltransferase
MEAIIPAAGRGTRLRPLTGGLPKALLEVGGRPILEHAMLRLEKLGARGFRIVVGWKGDAIRRRVGTRWKGFPVRCVSQPEPLGLAHAIHVGARDIGDPFLVMHGDVVFSPEADLSRLIRRFYEAGEAACILVERRIPRQISRGAVEVGPGGEVRALAEYPDARQREWGFVAAGLYALQPAVTPFLVMPPPSDAGEYELPDGLNRVLAQGSRIGAVELHGRRVNVNTPEELNAAERLLGRDATRT